LSFFVCVALVFIIVMHSDISLSVLSVASRTCSLRAIGEDEDKWRKWVNAKLIGVFTPNLYRNLTEAYAVIVFCLHC